MEIIHTISEKHGLRSTGITRVSGGDINEAFKITTSTGIFFLKLNDASAYPQMLQKEAEGLNALRKSTILKVPTVIAHGEEGDKQYLLLEWLEKASAFKDYWQVLAGGLAQLHRKTSERFGWQNENYIGSLKQLNDWRNSWAEFYFEQRLLPLSMLLSNNRSFTNNDLNAAEALGKKLTDIFPDEPPALLHGDLWAGNMMYVRDVDDNSKPAIYDPAVYYGHREMDIGMSLIFGGFDSSMYDHYNEMYPLENNWRRRLSLTQLYPLLVHAVLFGGGYVSQCRSILNKWR